MSFLPDDATWAGVMLLIIAGLFLAAITVGLIARRLMPERYVDGRAVHHSETPEAGEQSASEH